MGNNSKIRIKDIAKMAGVSVGTVDRVIHDRGNVSAETEKKIRAILQKTDYSPNPIAQSLGSKKNYRVAAIVPGPEQDEYWKESDSGIAKAKKEWEPYNIHIDLVTFDLDEPDSFLEASREVLDDGPDAVLTAPVFIEESLTFFQQLQTADIPYVLFNTQVNERIKKYNPLCFIGQDLYQSGKVAAELMQITMRDHGKIAVMHVHENIETSIHLKEKERGFRDYYSELNAFDDEICTFTFFDKHGSFESQIENCLAENDLKGIFVPTSSGTFLTAEALENQDQQDRILIGYDLLEKNINYLKGGTINFLINQNPRHQSLQGLRYLANHLLLSLEIPSADLLPLEIITRQNYTSFLNHVDS